MTKHPCFLIIGALALTLAACRPDPAPLVHEYRGVRGDEGWNVRDTIRIPVPPVPADGDYGLSVGMRVTNGFSWEGVWVEAELTVDTPRVCHVDTLFVRVYDEQARPQAEGVNLLQVEVPAPKSISLKAGQKGSLRLRHLMRRETLPFITDVGALIRREDSLLSPVKGEDIPRFTHTVGTSLCDVEPTINKKPFSFNKKSR